MSEIVQRAKEIIIANEGNYGTVVSNDNGALSIGICQWHADRAKSLLKRIILNDSGTASRVLGSPFYNEILGNGSWAHRITNTIEKTELSQLLSSYWGLRAQDQQASDDIGAYITHIQSLGFTDEETIIFLADIENQGGPGASARIGTAALQKYGKNVTLEEVLKTSNEDSVFKKYQARRTSVYMKLTTGNKLIVDGIMGNKTITALQKYLKVTQTGSMDIATIKALQTFLNLQM